MIARSQPTIHWPLARVLSGLLFLGFLGLAMDVRGEHVNAVPDHWTAWIPIVYSLTMLIPCALAFIAWRTGTRLLLLVLCVPALVIGPLGFYLHNRGHIGQTFRLVPQVWTRTDIDPSVDENGNDVPPRWAPLSIAGLGAIGVVIALRDWDGLGDNDDRMRSAGERAE